MSEDNWPFDQDKSVITFTTKPVMKGGSPIVYVCCDEDDGAFQFIGPEGAETKDIIIVSLEEVFKRDPSIAALANLPPGWCAIRESPEEEWHWEENDPDEDEDEDDDDKSAY